MKRIKSSFIGKTFFSLIVLYLIVFLFVFVFQSIVFRTYYTQRKVSEIKSEISAFIEKETYENIPYEELIFSRDTNTFSSIIPIEEIGSNLMNIDVSLLEVTTNDDVYLFYAPKPLEIDNFLNKTIAVSGYEIEAGTYIPSYLSIEDETIIRRNNASSDETKVHDLLAIDDSTFVQINGIVTNVTIVDEPTLNPLISNEILNITTQNYISLVNYEDGSYYFTNNLGNRSSSLVFFTVISMHGKDNLLISVYPMDYIDEIVLAAGRANVYMLIIVLIILILSAFIYSREFSRPLIFINKKTKELSQLNFSEPLIEVDSSDEFSELANNINILSINLKTTLHQLNEQNKQLLDKINTENKDENTRRDFIQGMSHELKTPLAIIQASAEAIEKGIYDTTDEKNKALLLIQNEVSKTKKMISDMMNVYRIDSPDYMNQWVEVDLKQLILTIDKMLYPLYKNSSLEVRMELEETTLQCEKEKLELVITNLLNNAIKYTPKHSLIEIYLRNYEHMIEFEVINHGVTLSKEDMEKVFDPFYRADKARSRNEGSTGLGLYIVNQTLKQYNSICEVTSEQNTVSFKFKIEKSI